MKSDIVNDRPKNLFLAGLFIAVTLFAAVHEGYAPMLRGPFLVLLLFGFACVVWMALFSSTKRMLALLLGVFLIEYVKESIGVASKCWTYNGPGHFYTFGILAWVAAAVTVYVVSSRVLIKTVSLLEPSFPQWLRPAPRWINPLCVAFFFWFIWLSLGEYWDGVGYYFVAFYVILFAVAAYTSIRMNFAVFAGTVMATLIAANLCEYLGAIAAGIWTFSHSPSYPPLFLVIGCWPLEILTQFALAAFLAAESLGQDAPKEKEES